MLFSNSLSDALLAFQLRLVCPLQLIMLEFCKVILRYYLLILLNLKQIPFALETKIMDEFYDIELETGEILSPLIYPKEEWNVKYRQTPLYENIKNESIRLI